MKILKDDLYNLVSDLMSKAEFEEKIANYSKKYSGLLTDDVLAHLIVDELGRNVTNFSKLSELKPGSKASLFAIVVKPKPKIFSKMKDNRKAAQVNVSDSFGSTRLILWDQHHVELVEKDMIKIGTKLKLLNAKITKSDYGTDLTLDRYESMIIDPVDFPEPEEMVSEISLTDIASITEDGPVNVMGTIAGKNQLRTFNRKNKSTGYVLNLELYDGTGKMRITLWDEHAKAAEDYNVGNQVKIINGYSKLHNSVREIHTNYRTQVFHELGK